MASMQPFESQSLNDWLFYLESQHTKEIDLGLDRTIKVANQADVLDMAGAKVVLVAGTNGKGTTIRCMEQYLLSLGHNVGVYGSPHMFTYHERVRINGEHLDDAAHVNAFRHIETARQATPLTYFEFGTLAAFYLLKQAALDFVLIEVGLGGRLDATNILPHHVSVITSLGLDHTDWLGDTIEQIGFEKAGIFRAGKPAVVGLVDAPDSVYQQARDHDVSELIVAGRNYQIDQNAEHWHYISDRLTLSNLPVSLIPTQNMATAITCLVELGVEVEIERLSAVIENLTLPGRMQVLHESPICMVDVAHNPHAVSYLVNTLKTNKRFNQYPKRHVVVAMMKDKDIRETLSLIAADVDTWYLAPLKDNPRAASVKHMTSQLAALAQSNIVQCDSIAEAWKQARTALDDHTLVLGFGSFFTVAEILKAQSESA